MTSFEAKQAGTLAEQNMKTMQIDWVTFDGGESNCLTQRAYGSASDTIPFSSQSRCGVFVNFKAGPRGKKCFATLAPLQANHGEPNPGLGETGSKRKGLAVSSLGGFQVPGCKSRIAGRASRMA